MTDVWQSILDEVPEYTGDGMWEHVTLYAPFKIKGVAYIHAPETGLIGDCDRCVAQMCGTPTCRALPDCGHTYFKEFEPADYTLMIAEGRTMKGVNDA